MGHVDSSQVSPLYANTTPGLTADANVFDPAIAALIVAINENFDSFEAFKAAVELPIPDQSIVTRHLRNLAVTNAKLAPLAVTADKIADGTITLAKLQDMVITAAKIANYTITENKYADGSVSGRAIASGAVDPTHLNPSFLWPYTDISIQANFDRRGFDITKYGAKGDWIQDDSDYIQNAINANQETGEIIIPKGSYLVKKQITFKDNCKIRFEGGGEIVTNSTFVGSSVFKCISGTGKGNGYMINPTFRCIDDATNATALEIEYCRNFKIYNINTYGYLKGGLKQVAGFELFVYGGNVKAPESVPTRNYSPFTYGVDANSSDGEFFGLAVVGYPYGVRSGSSNNFFGIHSWGLPSTGNVNDKLVTLYPFFVNGKNNCFTNCTADTMDIIDTTGSAGLSNGGIGFYEVEYALQSVFPWKNKYVNCRVIKHASSVNGKLMGFRFGDNHASAGINGKLTSILNPSFNDESSNLLEYIHIDNKRLIESTCVILGNNESDQLSTSNIGKQNKVMTNRIEFSKGMNLVTGFLIQRYFHVVLVTNTEAKLFDLAEVVYFTINTMSLANANAAYRTRVMMTSDGTTPQTTTFYPAAATQDVNYQIAKITYFNGTADTSMQVRIIKRSTGWYIVNEFSGHNFDMVLDITVRYA